MGGDKTGTVLFQPIKLGKLGSGILQICSVGHAVNHCTGVIGLVENPILSSCLRGDSDKSIPGTDTEYHSITSKYPGVIQVEFGDHISSSPESVIPTAHTSVTCAPIHICLC